MGKGEEMTRTVRVLRHGGREVLRIVTLAPVGESRMMSHARELTERLGAYAERELLPVAKEELVSAVEAGRGYCFFPHRFEVFSSQSTTAWGVRMTLHARHLVAERVISERALPTYWTRDGAWQKRNKRRIP